MSGSGCQLVSEDEDEQSYTFSLISGPLFAIELQGAITILSTPNYEDSQAITLSVKVTDVEGGSAIDNVIINIIDVNETPYFINNACTRTKELEENVIGPVRGGQMEASDPDVDAVNSEWRELTYTIPTDEKYASMYAIDSKTGIISTKIKLDYEKDALLNGHPVQIVVSDGKCCFFIE